MMLQICRVVTLLQFRIAVMNRWVEIPHNASHFKTTYYGKVFRNDWSLSGHFRLHLLYSSTDKDDFQTVKTIPRKAGYFIKKIHAPQLKKFLKTFLTLTANLFNITHSIIGIFIIVLFIINTVKASCDFSEIFICLRTRKIATENPALPQRYYFTRFFQK